GNDHVFLDSGPIHVRAFLRMMLFADEAADTRIGDLSGGERNRVQLTKLLRRGGNFLVLDEPTNDLDLVTLGVLEQALIEFPGCVLVVSHDRWFVDRVATALLVFEGDGKVVLHEGNHADYQARKSVEARAHRDRAPKTPSQKAKKRPGQVPATGPKKLTFKERRELAGIEDVIGAAEAEVASLEATLSDPEVFKDRGPEVPALVEKLDAARAEVDRLYARWQALEALSAAAPG
ncbi:MAG TPA: ATP-binding cassette domain-containing protein, partial [Kofleriaceae bacterium]|nr:ATP-binding cassette domain-containing protein [Kofleriaceae bacterium]